MPSGAVILFLVFYPGNCRGSFGDAFPPTKIHEASKNQRKGTSENLLSGRCAGKFSESKAEKRPAILR